MKNPIPRDALKQNILIYGIIVVTGGGMIMPIERDTDIAEYKQTKYSLAWAAHTKGLAHKSVRVKSQKMMMRVAAINR